MSMFTISMGLRRTTGSRILRCLLPAIMGLFLLTAIETGKICIANASDDLRATYGGRAVSWQFVENVLLGEGSNQGDEGLYAVACVMRNRQWDLSGFSAARRADLSAFALRQPRAVQRSATLVLEQVRAGGPDRTAGATHYENVAAFGIPRWAKGKRATVVIGDHMFWRIDR